MTSKIPVSDTVIAYNRLKHNLENIPDHKIRKLRFSASEATARGLWLASNAVRDILLFEEVYKNPPIAEINGLEQASLAIKGAQFLDNPDSIILPPDMIRAKEIRKKHLAILIALFFDDKILIEQINKINKGKGHLNLGSDMIDIAAFESKHWDKFKHTKLVTRDDIIELDKLGQEILVWVGQKTKIFNNTRNKERRAWSYMVKLYNIVRNHAYLLFVDNPKKWKEDYPNLMSQNKSSSTVKSSKKSVQSGSEPLV